MEEIVIIGAGGHAKVLIDIVEKRKKFLQDNVSIYGILDDNYAEENFLGYPYLGKIADLQKIDGYKNKKYIIAIGNNQIRENISKKLEISFITLIHPTAILGKNVKIGIGTAIMAGVIINSSSRIGNHTIINTGAIVEHDCMIDNYVHISPKVAIAGGVKIGKASWIGIGSSIIQEIRIGKNVMLGAGSVVVKNLKNNSKAFGVPAKEK
ncbi:MAG: acetyltransferase [Cetobacterium sp.]